MGESVRPIGAGLGSAASSSRTAGVQRAGRTSLAPAGMPAASPALEEHTSATSSNWRVYWVSDSLLPDDSLAASALWQIQDRDGVWHDVADGQPIQLPGIAGIVARVGASGRLVLGKGGTLVGVGSQFRSVTHRTPTRFSLVEARSSQNGVVASDPTAGIEPPALEDTLTLTYTAADAAISDLEDWCILVQQSSLGGMSRLLHKLATPTNKPLRGTEHPMTVAVSFPASTSIESRLG